jgi:hypothetical protein
MGNRQHSPWDKDGPPAHHSPSAKAEGEVVARSHGRDAEGSPRGLEDVEKRRVRVRERPITPRRCAHWQPLPDSPQAAAVGPMRLRVPGHKSASIVQHSHHIANSARRTVAAAGPAQKGDWRFLPLWSRDRSQPGTIFRP